MRRKDILFISNWGSKSLGIPADPQQTAPYKHSYLEEIKLSRLFVIYIHNQIF